MLWAGLLLLVVQWSLFLRLTFWELSWDVMEPISYFFSSLWGIVAYCYFLVRAPSSLKLHKSWRSWSRRCGSMSLHWGRAGGSSKCMGAQVTKEDFAFRHSYSKMNQTFRVRIVLISFLP